MAAAAGMPGMGVPGEAGGGAGRGGAGAALAGLSTRTGGARPIRPRAVGAPAAAFFLLDARTAAMAATATRAIAPTTARGNSMSPPASGMTGFFSTVTIFVKFWLLTVTSSLWSPFTAYHLNSSWC